ncbi:PREDICTED: optic atrophy 3 protein homolog, partial [Rhagoletis zephyria]|uniref:optic atrophy 3 protein homolog n=1 Tax=Rhagoletis zephyria TaxID=28612 RepID=UPI0008117975
MVLITLPIIKLSFLGIQQLSRPVIKLIRLEAKQSKTFRNYICMPAAQCYHWCEVRLKMLLLNLGRPAKVKPLNEAMAVELGTE